MVRLVVTLLLALFGSGFVFLRRYLAYRPGEVPRVCRLLDSAAEGCPGHGPAHLLIESAAEVGF